MNKMQYQPHMIGSFACARKILAIMSLFLIIFLIS